jgi:ketosteroid isomerase-like protein
MTKSLKEEFREINARYTAALNQRGAPGASAFFAEDVDLLPPGPENFKGAAAAQAFWSAASEHFQNARLTTVDVVALGSEFAREIGTYWGESRAPGGPTLSGKYVFIWRKVGNEWKIWTDIWTSHTGQT